MPQTPHTETHFTGGALVRDIVVGMSDSLTVPFALAAGLYGAVSSTHVVVVAGLAEIAAGSIAMGLGGFLAARSDAESLRAGTPAREKRSRNYPRCGSRRISVLWAHPGVMSVRRRRSPPQAQSLGGFHDAL